jgi:chromosome segregation ATPase
VDEPAEIRAVSNEIADMLREMDNGHSRTCPKSGDEVSESAPSVSIVDELRDCVERATKTYDDAAWYEVDDEDEHTWCSITVAEIDGIADRIEEQFARVCQQQEAVLLKQMDQQRAMLTEQRDAARAKVIALCNECDKLKRAADRDADHIESLSGAYNDMERERDELQAKLDELEKFDADTSLAAFGDDNDELRRLLSRAAKLLANAEQDRDANYAYWMDCKEKVVHANTTIEELQAKLDGIKSVLATDETEASDAC